MSDLQTISAQLVTINNRLARIEKKNQSLKQTWVSEDQAMAITNLSKKSLQVMRRNGKIKFRCLETGRKFQYQLTSLENLFL